MKKGGLCIKFDVLFPETVPKEIILGHQEHLAVEFYNSPVFAHQTKTFKERILSTVLKLKKLN